MFNVNDYIMYGTTGVCQITDIKKGKVAGNAEAEYYILNPVYEKNTTIMIPVNNQKVFMRILITRQDIEKLIEQIPLIKGTWINDDRMRNKEFKEALHTGKCEELIRLIKEIGLKREEKMEIGKKLRKSDEDIIKSAEKLLFEEFSISLQIPIEKVKQYILAHIPQ